jgi:hypothetical protein
MSFPQDPTAAVSGTHKRVRTAPGGEAAPPIPASLKRTEDTSSGCRGRAAASLVAAAAMDTENGRLRLQASADSWTARADLLQRLEDRHRGRAASQLDEVEVGPVRF